MKKPIFIIAGTHSGCGKTTISLGLMSALVSRGYKVQGYKVGPDFIDPGYHKEITKRSSHNLDTWMLSERENIRILFSHLKEADIGIIEGVMGLFDGYSATSDIGSTAHLAKIAQIPVILVVNVKSMARSVAPLVYGFLNYDKNLNIKGIIFNQIGSKKHFSILKDSLKNLDIKVYGALPKEESIYIPSRHLGLVTHQDFSKKNKWNLLLSKLIEENLNIDEILEDCSIIIEDLPEEENDKRKEKEKKVKIAVAMDNAFCFYYSENLSYLEKYGAELCFFSPLRDKKLPEGIKGIYLGGGYPELHGYELSNNKEMLKNIYEFSVSGGIIYAECGGFMYLTSGIKDLENRFWPMVGVFPFKCIMNQRFKALGYREIILDRDCILGLKSMKIRGHEFHYSHILGTQEKIKKVYTIKNLNGIKEGFYVYKTLGSYIHLHFGSNPKVAYNLIKNCEQTQWKV